MTPLEKEYQQYNNGLNDLIMLVVGVLIIMSLGALISCNTKPIIIGFEGSPNIIVKEKDLNIDKAVKLCDSLYKVDISNLLFFWDMEVDSLKRVIEDREERLKYFEKQKTN